MDVAQFRIDFPEFTDPAKFPPGQVTFRSTLGERLISADRLGDMRGHAVALYTAHHLSLAAANQRQARAGGIPGAAGGGTITSKSVGDVSASYSSADSMEPDAGHWNATTYGREYIDLVRMFGTGVLYVEPGCLW